MKVWKVYRKLQKKLGSDRKLCEIVVGVFSKHPCAGSSVKVHLLSILRETGYSNCQRRI